VTLRAARPEDGPLLHRIYASTRVDELADAPWPDTAKDAFIKQQYLAREVGYARSHPQAERLIVEENDTPVGSLWVDRGEDRLLLLDIALLPEHRGRGVGRTLLEGLQREAASRGVPLALQVAKTNRASDLYRRMGFHEIGDDDVYIRLEWHAPRG
jgi:ribosomal protein S18 acetylase RimI-like enzyme